MPLIAVFILHFVIQIEGYSLDHKFPTSDKLLLPIGQTSLHQCKGSLFPSDHEVSFQFIKSLIKVNTVDGPITFDGPFVLSNFSSLHPALLQTGRYSISGQRTNLDFEYTLTVKDVQIEDSGTYSCWIVHQSGHSLYPILGRFDVSITGPITKLEFYYESNGTKTEVQEGVLLFQLLEDSIEGNYVFQVDAPNVPQKWNVFIGSKTDLTQRNITSCFEITSPNTIPKFGIFICGKLKGQWKGNYFRGGKLSVSRKFYHSSIDHQVWSNRRNLYAAYCKGPVGIRNLTLICWARSNPLPYIEWSSTKLQYLFENAILSEEVHDDWVKSVLTIDQLTTEYLGSYTVIASNHYGFEYTSVTIKEGNAKVDGDISQGPHEVVIREKSQQNVGCFAQTQVFRTLFWTVWLHYVSN